MNRTTKRKQKRKQLLLYLILPNHHLEAGLFSSKYFLQTDSQYTGTSQKWLWWSSHVLQQPQGIWAPELSVRFHQGGMTICERSEDMPHIAAMLSFPHRDGAEHSGDAAAGEIQAGESRESLLFLPASELQDWETQLFFPFFCGFFSLKLSPRDTLAITHVLNCFPFLFTLLVKC